MGFPSSVVLGLGAAPVPVTAMTFWPVERAVAKPSFAADMANLPLCAVRAFCRDVRSCSAPTDLAFRVGPLSRRGLPPIERDVRMHP